MLQPRASRAPGAQPQALAPHRPAPGNTPFQLLADQSKRTEAQRRLGQVVATSPRVRLTQAPVGASAAIQLYTDEQMKEMFNYLGRVSDDKQMAWDIIRTAEALKSPTDDLVYKLAKSGKLKNLSGVLDLLNQILAAVSGDKPVEERIRNSAGFVWELEYALMAASSGDVKWVQLGAVDGVGGDLVTYGENEGETTQIKLVTGEGKKAVKDNIRKAINQLGGSGGETASARRRRVVDVTVLNESNPIAKMDESERVVELTSYIYDVNLDNVDIIFVRTPVPGGKVRNYSFNARSRGAPQVIDA